MAEDPRDLIERLSKERGEDYAGLSRLLGRNPAYVQQYIKRGTPKRLAEEDRRLLASYFGISETLLGAPGRGGAEEGFDRLIAVPRLDVEAAAGAGAFAGEERPLGRIGFDAAWLREMRIADRSRLSVIRVQGDSMIPTLSDGDEILIDGADGGERLRDGIYVLRTEEALVVKRLAINPAARRVSVLSDNEAYPSWPECDPAALDVVGRVVWVGRRLG